MVKMKVLITGTKGFIGRNLKETLSKDYEILTFEESDLNSDWRSKLDNIFNEDLKCVFHVGACSDTLEQNVNYMMLLNYEVTKYITDLCVNNGTPLIYSSSAANYGVNEEYPSNLYGWSKYVGEGYVISNGGIGLRYFNVYGPGEEDKGKMSSVAYQMYIKENNGEDIKLFPKKPLRDFVYVKDIVIANIFAFNNFNRLNSKWYEVGSGDARSFEDVLNYMDISYTYHEEDIIPNGYQFYTCSNKEKWMKGWEPVYDLKLGISNYKNYLSND
jgi:ADP-L-glycero-D-manno-heptose 6-epimerase